MGSSCSSEVEASSAPAGRATPVTAADAKRAMASGNVGSNGGKYAATQTGGGPASAVGSSLEALAKRPGAASGGPTTATRTTTTLVEADDEGEEAEMPGRGDANSGPQGLTVAPRKLEPAQLQRIKIASLRTTVLGECLSPDQLALLATLSDLRKYSRVGERILEQGSDAHYVYFVHKGEVLLEVQDPELDNAPNQAQVARVMMQQLLAPIAAPDQIAGKLPEVQQRARMLAQAARAQTGGMFAGGAQVDSLDLHPAAMRVQHSGGGGVGMARSTPTGQAGHKKSSNKAARERLQSNGACLTRAEVMANEAAARIEREALADDADAAAAAAAAGGSGSGSAPSPTHAHSGSLLEEPVIPAHASSRRPSADASSMGEAALPGTHGPAASLSSISDTMFMCAKGAQHCFGSELLLSPSDAPVSYAYSAINNALSTHLILVPVKAFEALWMTYPTIKPVLMSRMGEALHAALASTHWIGGVLPPARVTLLASMFTHARVDGGIQLFQEGDVCTDDSPLYFILDGRVELTLTNEKGHAHTKTLGPGSLFGELGTMLGFGVTVSAVSVGSCTLRLCKRRWLGLFSMLAPACVSALRSNFSQHYHVRDEQLLENAHIQKLFTSFCNSIYSGENVEFYNAAVRFRKVLFPLLQSQSGDDSTSLLSEAAQIYNRFISATSLLQINIREGVRKTIKEALQAGEVTRDIFFAAEREICNLMLLDTFGRFKQSPLYAQAMEQLAAPLPLPVLLNYVNLTNASGIHGLRAMEYSHTDEGRAGAGAAGGAAMAGGGGGAAPTTPAKTAASSVRGASSKAGGKSHAHFVRHVELIDDDEGQELCTIRPLMFGGAMHPRPAPTPSATGGAGAGAHLHVKVSSSGAPAGQSQGGRIDSQTDATPSSWQGPSSSPNHLAFPHTDSASVLMLSPGKDVFRVRPSALATGAGTGAASTAGEPMSASSHADLASPPGALDSEVAPAPPQTKGSPSFDLDTERVQQPTLEVARAALVSAASSGGSVPGSGSGSIVPGASASSSPNPSRPSSSRRQQAPKSALKPTRRPSVIQPPVLKDSPPVSVA